LTETVALFTAAQPLVYRLSHHRLPPSTPKIQTSTNQPNKTMEALTMQDIELCNVEVNQPLMRSLSLSESDQLNVDRIETKFGALSVFRNGVELTPSKPVLITYHDIGLNHVSNFQAFFNYMDMRLMLRSISGNNRHWSRSEDQFSHPHSNS
jgi:hypothetical protein